MEPHQVYRCTQCTLTITRPEHQLSIHGTTHHTRTNGAGFIHRFITFSDATHVQHHGIPTDDFTWFDGFTWEFARCAGCHAHLGWLYQRATQRFYGLLMTALYLSAE